MQSRPPVNGVSLQCTFKRQCGPVDSALEWNLRDIGSSSCFATDPACDIGQVTVPLFTFPPFLGMSTLTVEGLITSLRIHNCATCHQAGMLKTE